jgi:molybdopterin biosynthesis enzyme
MAYEFEPLENIEIEKAWEIIKENVKPLPPETIETRKAVGRIVYKNIFSPEDMPQYNMSHAEGFAVRIDDITTIPARLYLQERGPLEPGKAVFVRTGDKVPENADTIVPVENVRIIDEGVIEILEKPRKMNEIIPRGVDYRRGEPIALSGEPLHPMQAKALLDHGFEEIMVYRKPRLIVIPNGDELVRGEKRESISAVVCSTLEFHGAECLVHPTLPDDEHLIRKAVLDSLEKYDGVVLLAGSSIGIKDFSWRVVKHIGFQAYFRGLKTQPGKVTSLAVRDGKPLILLPGFIQSTFVGLVFVAIPVVKRLMGSKDIRGHHPYCHAILENDLILGKKFQSFTRIRFVKLGINEGFIKARAYQAYSYTVSPIVNSDGFIMIPPGPLEVRKGDRFMVYQAPGLTRTRLCEGMISC